MSKRKEVIIRYREIGVVNPVGMPDPTAFLHRDQSLGELNSEGCYPVLLAELAEIEVDNA